MADVITRFKLETTQYDSALRDASKSLSAYSKQAELAGKDFDKFTKGGVEAARALGSISTSATNTKDKVKELVSAYNDVAKAYNKLTEEQKKSDFGKAMASSLEQLQGRIKDAKAEMNSTGGVLSQLRERFTVNIDALKLFSVGLQAAQGALSVAKDAFFKNEEQLDEWGRIVESSKSLYSGFLDALNTGDISGYLTRIGEITRAAQNAYNALDALNTFNAFNQVNVEKTRTGMTESIADYRSGQGTKEQVKAAGEAYQNELRERQKLEKQAYLEAIKKVAAERGVNGNDLITALSGSYGSYESLKAIPMSGSRTKFTPGGMFGGSTAYEEAYPVNRQEQLGAALRKLNDTELQSLQALGAQAERTGNEIAQVDKQLTRVLNGRQPGASSGGSGGGKSTKSGDTIKLKIDFDINKAALAATKADESGTSDAFKAFAASMKEQTTTVDDLTEAFKALNKAEGVDPQSQKDGDNKNKRKSRAEKAKEYGENATVMRVSSDLTNGVNGILSGIEQMGIEIPEGLKDIMSGIQGVMTILTSINTILGVIEGLQTVGILPFLARGGIVPHAATGYIVPGNSFSGDNTPIMANAGELVLNQAQQGNLASQLSGAGRGMNIVGEIQGEKIVLVANRFFKRTGQGEIVTW